MDNQNQKKNSLTKHYNANKFIIVIGILIAAWFIYSLYIKDDSPSKMMGKNMETETAKMTPSPSKKLPIFAFEQEYTQEEKELIVRVEGDLEKYICPNVFKNMEIIERIDMSIDKPFSQEILDRKWTKVISIRAIVNHEPSPSPTNICSFFVGKDGVFIKKECGQAICGINKEPKKNELDIFIPHNFSYVE